MNILPKLLYLLQTLPKEISQKKINDGDKILSRYIKGKVKGPDLDLKPYNWLNEKGGGAFLLSRTIIGQHGTPIICWCNHS